MKGTREMRHEAWDVLKGKWFWRLLCVAALLQLARHFANGLVGAAFDAMSITSVVDFMVAKINAAQQGLSYSLPTTKAYCWMFGGFCFQMFIAYIFAAIFAFGFMGLLLKASRNDDSRWFADAFGGFARPLDVAWLLVLMNLLVFLAMVPCMLVFGGAAFVLMLYVGLAPLSLEGLGILTAASVPAVLCAISAAYGYRQAWFIKNERPEAPALGCLRASWQMMKGFKWRAFCLDFSFLGWIFVGSGLLTFAAVGAGVAERVVSHPVRVVAMAAAFGFGMAAFWLFVKVFLGIAVARVVFYRELKGGAA